MIQERRNAFAHGNPSAIDDTLVRRTVEQLKAERGSHGSRSLTSGLLAATIATIRFDFAHVELLVVCHRFTSRVFSW